MVASPRQETDPVVSNHTQAAHLSLRSVVGGVAAKPKPWRLWTRDGIRPQRMTDEDWTKQAKERM